MVDMQVAVHSIMDVAKVSLGPGDVLLVRVSDNWNMHMCREFQDYLIHVIDRDVIVLPAENVSVLRLEEV